MPASKAVPLSRKAKFSDEGEVKPLPGCFRAVAGAPRAPCQPVFLSHLIQVEAEAQETFNVRQEEFPRPKLSEQRVASPSVPRLESSNSWAVVQQTETELNRQAKG